MTDCNDHDCHELRLPVTCLVCATVSDAHAGIADPVSAPRAGDVSLCAYCGAIAMFGDDMQLRAPTDDELTKIVQDGTAAIAAKALAYAARHGHTIGAAIGAAQRTAARRN